MAELTRGLLLPILRPITGVLGGPPPIAPAFARGELSVTGQALDGETVTIGATVYTFRTVLGVAYDVAIGASASLSFTNLASAIMDAGLEGTDYGTGTLEHPDVTAGYSLGVMTATAKVIGPAGNSIATTETVGNATWGAATLQGGA